MCPLITSAAVVTTVDGASTHAESTRVRVRVRVCACRRRCGDSMNSNYRSSHRHVHIILKTQDSDNRNTRKHNKFAIVKTGTYVTLSGVGARLCVVFHGKWWQARARDHCRVDAALNLQ